MQKCRQQQQPSPVLERSLKNVSDLAAQLSDDHLIKIVIQNRSHTRRSRKLATKGVHIFDLLKTLRVSLLLAWCAKVQAAAAAVACAREVLNKCV